LFAGVDQSLRRIEIGGEVLGNTSSALSDLIAAIEGRLNAAAGKLPAGAETRSKEIKVTFERGKGNDWCLWLLDDDCVESSLGPEPERLISVSVFRKARAVPVLLDLLEIIERRQAEYVKEVKSALATIATFSDARRAGTEGK